MKSVASWAVGLGILTFASTEYLPHSIAYETPYSTPVVEKLTDGDPGTFDGLLTLAESLPPSSSIKVLWTHGMCSHPASWVDDRMKRLTTSIGGTSETLSVRRVGDHAATLRTDRIKLRSSTIDVMFLTWSPLTAPYKAALAYDHSTDYGGAFPYTRASLNRELKRGLINDCMTDVVVYGGANGQALRRAAKEAVCQAMGGRIDGTACEVPEGASPAALAFVTESLGSKLVFDAILSIWGAAEKSNDKTAIPRLATSLASTRMMYMVANQLPLLDVAGTSMADRALEAALDELTTPGHSRDVFDVISRARRHAAPAAKPMTVVAFSDPNDLLSYRIIAGHLAGDLKDFRVVNVIVSNDTTYFKYVERPDTAHCGYTWNPYVFGMIAKGYDAGKALPSVVGLTGGACPNFDAMQN
ncbi:hypothetical protein [Reyranella soli]|uniref:Uncharacterized protein n=1 Tax=Reyranella soli TaxID=1230389 RepID=A0A512NG77_9HYPH|nr:hypothetical protein [Reyranella soli]GEP57912.1 hypothetical protein RSO01_50780 [Reyranella soli]